MMFQPTHPQYSPSASACNIIVFSILFPGPVCPLGGKGNISGRLLHHLLSLPGGVRTRGTLRLPGGSQPPPLPRPEEGPGET